MSLRNISIALLLFMELVLAAIRPAQAADPALPPGLCFLETGKCVRGLFYAYWSENGKLARQGLPITDEFNELNPTDGKAYRVQYFERARFEYHPENVNTPFVVLLGLLAKDQFQAKYPEGRPATDKGELCFQETRQCLRGTFFNYWRGQGGLALFGYPLSDEFDELNPADGKTYKVQYFERARFEYHPQNVNTPFEVLLGLLGREAYHKKYPDGQPTATNLTVIPLNVYAATTDPEVKPALAGITPRVYVPNELGNTVDVIDPATFQVVDHYPVGAVPHHISPSSDLTKLHINNMGSSSLTEIDVRTGRPVGQIGVPVPYNLYYTPDGSKAIIAAEPNSTLLFYDPKTWKLLKSVYIPWLGIDHMDMSADGRYLLASTEYSGVVVKVDTVRMEIAGAINVGGLPIDIKLSPDGAVFYVANQGRHGVSVIDPVALKEIAFLPTGTGAHGLAISRNTRQLYVANRLAGTISVIDFDTRLISATWNIGGSPDMLQVSPDGSQLWASGRFNGVVYVIDTRTGQLSKTIPVGSGPHGLAYFPQPGRISLGHNGVYR